MALTKCTVPTDVIGGIGTNPEERGLTTQQFKDKFDEMPEGIKKYLNEVLTVEVDAHMADTTWIAPTLLNGWSNFGGTFSPAGYIKDTHGFVHLRGLIKGGTSAINTELFTLAVGCRPEYDEYFTVYTATGAAVGTINIRSNGTVFILTGSNTDLSLSGITFKAV